MPMTSFVPPARPAPRLNQDLSAIAKSIDALRGEFRKTQRSRLRWKRAFAVTAALGALATAGFVTAAVTNSTTSFTGLFGESLSYDESTFTVSSGGTLTSLLAVSAAGGSQTTASAVEIAATSGAASTGVTANHWYYQATISEAGAAVLSTSSSTAGWKIELFKDGTSEGALYVKQATAVDASVESVTCKWDIGTSVSSAAWVIKITSVTLS